MAGAVRESFVDVLRRSGLLSVDRLEALRHLDARLGSLHAEELVRRGWLTSWQARRVLDGKASFRLGRHLLLRELGRGGMGAVYLSKEMDGLRRTTAIKLISRRFLDDPTALARFEREADAAMTFDHPNIVAAHHVEEIAGRRLLVMEFVPGVDLDRALRDYGRLPIGWACECIRQALVGLQYAHERGYVHRDLKPGNLLVSTDEAGRPEVKILDLGLARPASEDDSIASRAVTKFGQIVGTVDYISPEQAAGWKSIDVRSDIYSLGCTLFHLIGGEVPFEGESVMARLFARGVAEAPRLRTRRPEAQAALEDVVAKMLARRAEDRYQTPLEAAWALEPFCDPDCGVEGPPRTTPAPIPLRDLPPPDEVDRDLDALLYEICGDSGLPRLADPGRDTDPPRSEDTETLGDRIAASSLDREAPPIDPEISVSVSKSRSRLRLSRTHRPWRRGVIAACATILAVLAGWAALALCGALPPPS